MITRRSVRIKAMQYIYACETTQTLPPSHFAHLLEKSILSVKEQYLYLLFVIREIANFVELDAKIKANKHLKNEEDKNFSTKLLSNILIQFLNNDIYFLKEISDANIKSLVEDDNIRQMYKKMIESETYQKYITNGSEFDLDADKKILLHLLNDIILQDDIFIQTMEEHFINWMEDAEFVVEAVYEVLQKSKTALKLHLEKGSLKEKFKEITQLGIEIFNETIQHKEQHQKFIEPKLKNWDAERLAIVDVILIRMAISEFLYFPSIPIKVTINEYLDIAKEYSTPKSKDFINGVLDSLMREFKQKELLQKTGRGLL